MANLIRIPGGGTPMRYALNKERWTGDYWVDGKKIYRRCVLNNQRINSNYPIDVSTFNIDKLLGAIGCATFDNGYKHPFPYSDNGNTITGTYVANDTLYVKSIYANNIETQSYVTVVIEYTKTTETGA